MAFEVLAGGVPPIVMEETPSCAGLRKYFFSPTVEGQVQVPIHSRSGCKENDVLQEVKIIRPDIMYLPSWDTYVNRTNVLLESRAKSTVNNDLPEGFPRAITGPRVWTKDNAPTISELTFPLSDSDVQEIEAALAHYTGLPGDNGPDHVTQDLFPLPTLGPKLKLKAKDLHDGLGLFLLRGLSPQKYTAWENVIMFTGIASYVGEKRGCQDGMGNMLTHLVDFASVFGKDVQRPPAFQATEMPFHNDVCDLLAFYVQDSAPAGGETTIASSATVYNEIAANRTDVVRTLASPSWVYDTQNAPDVWPTRALAFNEPEHGPFFCVSRRKLTGAPDFTLTKTMPAMSEEQAEALDMLHFTSKKHSIALPTLTGDMVFCNNLAIMHARNAYAQNWTDEHKRHVMRLWLRNEELAWKTPEGLANDWFKVYGESERRSHAFWPISPEDINNVQSITYKYSCWN